MAGFAKGTSRVWSRLRGGAAQRSIATVDPNVFYEITIRQDYNAQTWDCWIDGSLEGQDLGFRDVVTEISGIRVFAGVESYFDTFLLRENNPPLYYVIQWIWFHLLKQLRQSGSRSPCTLILGTRSGL